MEWTKPEYECRVFENGHIMQLDLQHTSPSKTTYTCACGESVVEMEDAGTGA